MSLTDDTNVNTNDIPLPSDPTSVPVAATTAANSSKAHTNGYNPDGNATNGRRLCQRVRQPLRGQRCPSGVPVLPILPADGIALPADAASDGSAVPVLYATNGSTNGSGHPSATDLIGRAEGGHLCHQC